jgi:hypothetical protein
VNLKKNYFVQALGLNLNLRFTSVNAVNSDSIGKELVHNIHRALQVIILIK